MKSIIVYYSYSGNTRKVGQVLCERLKQEGQAELVELKALDESDNFFRQAGRAFWRRRGKLAEATLDLSQYDLICLGTPVWAFGPAPAMNSYLDKLCGVAGKQIILFTTYGSGTGNSRCLNYMQDLLSKKGAGDFKRFSVQQFKVNDREFVALKIKEIMPLSPNG